MNINNFDYKQNPILQLKKFKIHPLSEEGLNQYINKEAYTHKFLRSLSPGRVEEIFNFNDYKKTEVKPKRTEEEEKNEQNLEADNFHLSKINTNQTKNIKISELNMELKGEGESFTPNSNREYLQNKSFYKINSQEFKKTGFTQTFSKKNYYNLSPTKNMKNKSQVEAFTTMKYKENHVKNIDNLRTSLNNLKNAKENEKKLLYRKKVLGIKSFEVPHTDQFKSNYLMSPKVKIVYEKLNKIFDKTKNPFTENDKLINYMSSVKEYESSDKFPNLKILTEQREITNVDTIFATHFMGEKYNPMNYYHNSSKSMVRRNLHGALFNH